MLDKTPADEGAHHAVARIDALNVVFVDKTKPAKMDMITNKVIGKFCTR